MKKYFIKQEDEADCGACSMLSVIKYYKGYVPLEVIKIDTHTTNNGTSFYNMKEALIKYGFDVYGICNREIKDIPFIAQLKINDSLYHFVVVYEYGLYVTVMDPAVGYKKYSMDEFNKLFTGNALIMKPISKIVHYSKKNPFSCYIIKLFKNNKNKILIILVLSLILVGLSLFNIYNLKLVTSGNKVFLIIFIIFSVLKLFLMFIKNKIVAQINKILNYNLIRDYLKHFMNLPLKYLQLKSSGEVCTRVNDLNTFKDFLAKEIVNIIINILFLIGGICFIFYLNYKLSIILVSITIIYFIISIFINKKIYINYLNSIDSETEFMDNTIEVINRISNIKCLNKTNYFFNRINNLNKYNINNNYNLELNLSKNSLFINSYEEISLILIIINGYYNSSDIFIYLLFYNYFMDSIKYYMNLIPILSYLKGLYNKISSLYYLDEEDANKGNKISNGDIIIRNLSYKNNLNEIFTNFNLKIPKGSKVLLIGNNGSGKSTLLNMLYGNIDNYNGLISINNIDIKDVCKNNLRTLFSYINQDSSLFTDSILNNIIMDNPYNENKLNKISNILELSSIFNKKGNGINSLVKNNLSGGERQRIILARALYSESDILLLDEAFSEISSYLRFKIINNINKYYKDKTIIYVSHNYEKYPYDIVCSLTARKE